MFYPCSRRSRQLLQLALAVVLVAFLLVTPAGSCASPGVEAPEAQGLLPSDSAHILALAVAGGLAKRVATKLSSSRIMLVAAA
mmetsp:Transcript_82471/g.215239  ORF Transcript_82471/g.215239 Transcript_82471/m.215239 type:complete len:83 (-) Transcript_82471:78-326(-)